jgi:hypothetical protein
VACIDWMRWFNQQTKEEDIAAKRQLQLSICRSFNVQEVDILRALEGGALVNNNGHHKIETRDDKLYKLLPKGGWFEWYAEATEKTESPLAYHIFSSLTILGAALGRRVYKPMGWFNIWPNYCVILVGKTAIKKTSATDIAASFVRNNVLCPIMADTLTPESFATTLAESGGHQYVHAGELSVFFGRQRYNEGMVEKFLKLLDCPEQYIAKTVKRGEEIVHQPTLSVLGASTLSLMSSSTPQELMSGGFLNRFMIVVEHELERCFPSPQKGSEEIIAKLNGVIERFKGYTGEMLWSSEANKLYEEWYRRRWNDLRHTEEEHVREVIGRTGNHTIKTAMLLHLAQCDTLTICADCFNASVNMVAFVEENLPGMVKTIKQSAISSESDYVLNAIIKSGGIIDHSTLLRKVGNRMGAPQMRGYIATLRESGRVKEVKQGAARYYVLQEENNDSKK